MSKLIFEPFDGTFMTNGNVEPAYCEDEVMTNGNVEPASEFPSTYIKILVLYATCFARLPASFWFFAWLTH
jgi:hypothetical protein